jgi:hypothetical protein
VSSAYLATTDIHLSFGAVKVLVIHSLETGS